MGKKIYITEQQLCLINNGRPLLNESSYLSELVTKCQENLKSSLASYINSQVNNLANRTQTQIQSVYNGKATDPKTIISALINSICVVVLNNGIGKSLNVGSKVITSMSLGVIKKEAKYLAQAIQAIKNLIRAIKAGQQVASAAASIVSGGLSIIGKVLASIAVSLGVDFFIAHSPQISNILNNIKQVCNSIGNAVWSIFSGFLTAFIPGYNGNIDVSISLGLTANGANLYPYFTKAIAVNTSIDPTNRTSSYVKYKQTVYLVDNKNTKWYQLDYYYDEYMKNGAKYKSSRYSDYVLNKQHRIYSIATKRAITGQEDAYIRPIFNEKAITGASASNTINPGVNRQYGAQIMQNDSTTVSSPVNQQYPIMRR